MLRCEHGVSVKLQSKKHPKTPRQKAAINAARDSSAAWDRKLEILRKEYDLIESKDKEFREKFEPSVTESNKRNYKSQNKCAILFLALCSYAGYISPDPFGEVKDRSIFCGWLGFQVLPCAHEIFNQKLTGLFALPGGTSCLKKTIQKFFLYTMKVKPLNKHWSHALDGKVPFVPSQKVSLHV